MNTTSQPLEHFQHQPLDHSEQSIRLIQILPHLSSPCGRIQCRIVLATISASYTCVSYQWGPPNITGEVLVNGAPFAVRQNLHKFLQVIREMLSIGDAMGISSHDMFWIDALSIDQTNNVERNHQVAQMGQIFSNSRSVLLWLGDMPRSVPTLVETIMTLSTSYEDLSMIYANKGDLKKYIMDNTYWSRAWITQEILLARHVKILLGTTIVDFQHDMISGLKQFYLVDSTHNRHFSQFMSCWNGEFHASPLLTLLCQFQNKECEHRHDRIYSLLSLCSDVCDRVEVDYNISTSELARRILTSYQESGQLCLCTAILVSQALGLHEIALHSKELTRDDDVPYIEYDVVSDALRIKPHEARWGLYCFEENKDIDFLRSCTLLDFQDTCESSSLACLRLAWDDEKFATPSGEKHIYWMHAEPSASPQQLNLFKLRGPHIIHYRRYDLDMVVVTIRFPLWLLARIYPSSADLCVHATASRVRRRKFKTQYPRMVFESSDYPKHRFHRDLPPFCPDLAPPEHVIRSEIAESALDVNVPQVSDREQLLDSASLVTPRQLLPPNSPEWPLYLTAPAVKLTRSPWKAITPLAQPASKARFTPGRPYKPRLESNPSYLIESGKLNLDMVHEALPLPIRERLQNRATFVQSRTAPLLGRTMRPRRRTFSSFGQLEREKEEEQSWEHERELERARSQAWRTVRMYRE